MPGNLKHGVAVLALLAALGGCSLAPDLEVPKPPVAGTWPDGPAYAGAGKADAMSEELGWEAVFRPAPLKRLIKASLENNRDLRVAVLNVAAARASYGVARSAQFPAVDANGGRTRARTPANLNSSGRIATATEYTANLGVTAFELDLFGRVRSLSDKALETFFATAEAASAARIALVAQVADAWLAYETDRRELKLTRDTLEAQQKTYDLVLATFTHGIGSQLDVAQSRTSVETARANLARYTRAVAQDRNALELLVGRPLTEADLACDADDIAAFVAAPEAGLASDVLLRRPDIREAEHSLRAANANIGAARAAFWPSISLTGTFGYASTKLNGLFEGAQKAWTFAPGVSLPIFDAGMNFANLDAAKAERDITIAQYEKAVQTAFREVADSLAARKTLAEQLAAQSSLVEATQQSYDLSRARYSKGISSYLAVLDAQRSLYSAQESEIDLQRQAQSNLVTLYKAMGGGEPPAPETLED